MKLAKILKKADFDKQDGLLPAIIQDNETNKVLMLGYMNEEAVELTFKHKKVTFYSRSKDRIWVKGETSGNFLELISADLDCDNDALLVKVNPIGPVCHTGSDTCWKEVNKSSAGFMHELEEVIKNRYAKPSDSSYTSELFAAGINKIAQKVGEEAIEVVIEAKDDNEDLFISEVADLMYHLTVLLTEKDCDWKKVEDKLLSRSK